LAFWFLTCFVAPRTAFAVAQRYEQAPTAREFAEELARVDREVPGFLEHRAAIAKRLLAEHRVSSATELPVSTWGVTLFEREIESTHRFNDQFNRLFEAYRRQQRVVDLIAFASPPTALRTLSMALAGTDVAHFRHFAEAAERYRYELVQAMNQVAVESRLYNSNPSLTGGPDQPVFPEGERAAYGRVGRFAYSLPPARWAVSQAWLSIVSLVAWQFAAIGAAFASLRRIEAF
jgi:ABC-2 type transport system permease protein